MDGTDSLIDKTLPISRERNEDSSENSSRVVRVPVVVEPVVVPVPPTIVPVEVTNVEVAVRVAIYARYHPLSPPLDSAVQQNSWGCILFGIYNA